MSTQKEIEECVDTLIQNYHQVALYTDRLTQTADRNVWEKNVMERSELIRKCFPVNEACIAKIQNFLDTGLDEKNAIYMQEMIRKMYAMVRVHPAIICQFLEPLISFFMDKGIVSKTISCITSYGSTHMDYYNRMVSSMNVDEVRELYKWAVEHREGFPTFTDKRDQYNVFTALSNLMNVYLLQNTDEDFYRLFEENDLMKSFWERKDIQDSAIDRRWVNTLVEGVLSYMPSEVPLRSNLNETVRQRMIQYYSEWCGDLPPGADWNDQVTLEINRLKYQFFNREKTIPELIESLLSLGSRIPKPQWKTNTEYSQIVFQVAANISLSVFQLLDASELPVDKREKYALQSLTIFQKASEDIPAGYMASYIEDIYRNILQGILPHITSRGLKETLILRLLITRQPSTLFHSIMVEKIALAVAEEIFRKEPELFLSMPEYSSVEQIKEDKERLFQFISGAARFHDAGKCCIAAVVMEQSRRLTDKEFQCIKAHPDLGADFMKNDPAFAPYADVIRGHHKSYDGKGYPADFDNTASPYRFIIDLISICDSADAATDITGRNYAPGKDFLRLLGELQEGAGTRYNPDIVRIISEAPDLIQKLTEITGPGRLDICYDAYRMCYGQ